MTFARGCKAISIFIKIDIMEIYFHNEIRVYSRNTTKALHHRVTRLKNEANRLHAFIADIQNA
jgi:hypothetical protein